MFVVNYVTDYDAVKMQETFGPFETKDEALQWMKDDVEHNINNAKGHGIEFEAETKDFGNTMEIAEYGTWHVSYVTPVK